LIRGLTVEGLPGWDGGRGQTIRYIDWDTPANNRFTVSTSTASIARPASTAARPSSCPTWCCW
jgi:type I restriction enzyme R subunit